MATQDFYAANRNRGYPFVAGTVGSRAAAFEGTGRSLPLDAVVDAGFVAGSASGFDPSAHSVWLDRLSRTGDTFTFEFASDAPALAGRPLVFTRHASDADYATSYSDDEEAPAGDPTAEPDPTFDYGLVDCPYEPLWSGFLVTGRTASLGSLLTDGGAVARTAAGQAVVEPALVQSAAGTYVNSVSLANVDRTRVDNPAGCPEVAYPWPAGEGVYHVAAKCLKGPVWFSGGFNAFVRQDDATNTITFGAMVGAGEGEPCDGVTLFDGEAPPPGSNLLEGGPRCNEVVRSINGVGGAFSLLTAGAGVRVVPLPEQHTLLVSIDMSQLAVCYEAGVFSEVSEAL